ncbi:MAG: molybdopterin molybdotransferase MoeA [Planctomycetota bacterium]|nr:molybdopterin molybdotransferase MoeA [Planctomycetota bacterium]MDA1214228.1 molybdopterin molybdotransferase MoeA [Planctomycetota bacterium]
MLSVSEAIAAILKEIVPLPTVDVPLERAAGMVLATSIKADRDIPPFDKSVMDGYAFRWDDLASGTTTFSVVDEITAGHVPTQTIHRNEAARIMTGAMLPAGADTVVRQEDVTVDGKMVTINVSPGECRTNVLTQGGILKSGQTLLHPGGRLTPAQIGASAEMGTSELTVSRRPQVAVLATGDELVPFAVSPGPGQIRNSNEVMLCSLVERAGGEPTPLGIARDNAESLTEKIGEGLVADVLILSGGVSAGKLDLVPSQLERSGVKSILHKVWMKPGKPIWFGVRNESTSRKTYVFGLPGNPVSSLAGFELFVKPALKALQNLFPAEPQPRRMALGDEFVIKGDRPTYQPVRWDWSDSGPTVYRVSWKGSADLQGAAQANALALFEPRDTPYRVGESVDVYLWD